MIPSPKALAALCHEMAQSGAALANSMGPKSITEKTSSSDLVTAADTAVEASLRDLATTIYPEASFIGEESGGDMSGFGFIVDPIDGTTNFAYGRPDYTCSVAAHIEGEVVAASLCSIPSNLDIASFRGEPTRNQLSAPRDLRHVLVDMSSGRELRHLYPNMISALAGRVRDTRRSGCCSLSLAQVSTGQLDAYIGVEIKIWDYAAGLFIAEQAGAKAVWLDTPTRPVLVLAHPSVVDELATLVRTTYPAP